MLSFKDQDQVRAVGVPTQEVPNPVRPDVQEQQRAVCEQMMAVRKTQASAQQPQL